VEGEIQGVDSFGGGRDFYSGLKKKSEGGNSTRYNYGGTTSRKIIRLLHAKELRGNRGKKEKKWMSACKEYHRQKVTKHEGAVSVMKTKTRDR